MDLSVFQYGWYLSVSCVHCPPSGIFSFVIVVQSNQQTPVKWIDYMSVTVCCNVHNKVSSTCCFQHKHKIPFVRAHAQARSR